MGLLCDIASPLHGCGHDEVPFNELLAGHFNFLSKPVHMSVQNTSLSLSLVLSYPITIDCALDFSSYSFAKCSLPV
jgi:hypothetical protein